MKSLLPLVLVGIFLLQLICCEEEYQIGRVIRQISFPGQHQQHGNFRPPQIQHGQFRPTGGRPHQQNFWSKPNRNGPLRPIPAVGGQIASGPHIGGTSHQGVRPHQPQPQRPVHHVPASGGGGCGNCVLLVSCPALSMQQHIQGCSLPNGAGGVCCPHSNASPPWGGITRLFSPQKKTVPIQPFTSGQLNLACEKGVSSVKSIEVLENRIMQSSQVVPKGTPARGHLKFFSVTRTARSTHKAAMAITMASESMKRDFQLTNEQGCIGLKQFSARNTILSNNCLVPPRCNNQAKYRTLDGSCNNLRKSLWGKGETAFQRILPAKYDDGIRAPRTRSVTGNSLPNERLISNTVLIDLDNPDPQFTISVMQWGQFVDHDLTHAPFSSFENEEGKECCRNGQLVRPQLLEDCWPIEILPTDEFYATKNQRCMNFVRSMLAEDDECSFGCAEQMNQVTHWMDGSNIYGSSDEEANAIRDHRTGLLRVSENNMLPYQTKKSHDCEATEGTTCFTAGDSRVNEQPGLTAIHTIWHREHNRVANILRNNNRNWSPEQVYQEARRIVVAEYNHITYNEWLPIIVGEQFMGSFDIMPKRNSYNLDYNPNINPNMNNEFATSAFRFGHTLVQGTMSLFSRLGRQTTLRLKDHFNSPHLFQRDPEMVDKFARTFSKQNIQQFDSFITKELTNHLFETRQTNFGMDLMSLNIHRGRDHAIATYNEMRVICGLPRARDFNGIRDQIPEQTIRRLASVYQHVDDIDFFVGGISETPVSGGLLGWTFLCVVGDQFARVKKGDRFFYDLGGQPGSFTPDQLREVRKVSWSRVLCDNSNMGSIQPLSFRLPQGLNREVSCNSPSIPRMNMNFWR